jgi:hypothetical protein
MPRVPHIVFCAVVGAALQQHAKAVDAPARRRAVQRRLAALGATIHADGVSAAEAQGSAGQGLQGSGASQGRRRNARW